MGWQQPQLSIRKVLTLTWWQLSVAASGKYKAGYPLRKRSDLHKVRSDLHKVVVISKALQLHNLKRKLHSITSCFLTYTRPPLPLPSAPPRYRSLYRALTRLTSLLPPNLNFVSNYAFALL